MMMSSRAPPLAAAGVVFCLGRGAMGRRLTEVGSIVDVRARYSGTFAGVPQCNQKGE